MSYTECLSEIDGSARISANVAELRIQKNKLIQELAFLQGTIGSEEQKKLNNSYSGQIASQFSLWAGRLLVLGVNRCFDRQPPIVISTLKEILEVQDQIVLLRRKAYPNWSENQLGIPDLGERIETALAKAVAIHESPAFIEMRIFRTEELAHSLESISRDRKKFGFSADAARPTFAMIMELAEQTIILIDSIISFWEFHVENSEQTLQLYAAYARTYWKALPNFSETEDLSFVSDIPWQP